jgi:DNA-binding NarL/FixJ family response regulator
MAISVLVVDDDPAFRDLAERLLTGNNLEVVGQAGTATEAITAAKAIKPDGVLVDVDLPDRNGIALTSELRALPWRPKVVLTSADADAARPDDVRSSGASAFRHR